MKRIVYVTLTLLLAAFFLAGCGAASAGKMYGKDDKDITVAAGETFTIELEANPTTGYDWTAKISDETVVKLENIEYHQQPVDTDVVGAGGVDTLTFKGLKKGSATITLTYERSFEEGSAVDTLVYNVTVQ